MNKDLIDIITRHCPLEGHNLAPVKGVHAVRITISQKRMKRHWRACLAIVIQGTKEVVLGRKIYLTKIGAYTATPFQLPVISRVINATEKQPFLALLIDLDPVILNEVAELLELQAKDEHKKPAAAFFRGDSNEKMKEAIYRLIRTFDSPEDSRALAPIIIREIFYHLLRDEESTSVRQYVLSGSKMQNISKAIHLLKLELHKEINIPMLAKKSSMSRSAFFKHFKEVTSMSPIQYQKRLRLLEAKRLISHEQETAESAAFKVGYKSASQFSREYSRMFGKSPLKDARA